MSAPAAVPAKFANIFDVAGAFDRAAAIPKVYPAYLAFRARNALRQTDPDLYASEQIVDSVSAVETLGDSRYAFTVTAHNGTRHRITIEVEK